MARRKVSNPLALAVLAWLMAGPTHPYELGRRFTEVGLDRSIKYNRGSLYMVVEQLTKAGFITAEGTIRDSQRPERTLYALTDEGKTELYDWLSELVSEPKHEYPQFGVALSLMSVLPPSQTIALLGERLTALAQERDALREQIDATAAGGVLWIFLVEDEFRLTLMEAEIAFVTKLIGSLDQPDYIRVWQEIFGSMT
jgi:DNA-binding PadR family transcriptional regulator